MPTFLYSLVILEGGPGKWAVQSTQGANPGLPAGKAFPHWVDVLGDAGSRDWEYVERQEEPNKIVMLLRKVSA